jgi:hypothetical protein
MTNRSDIQQADETLNMQSDLYTAPRVYDESATPRVDQPYKRGGSSEMEKSRTTAVRQLLDMCPR